MKILPNSKSLLTHLLLAIITIMALIPLAMIVSTSLKTSSEIYNSNFSWLPQGLAWNNFTEAFHKINFLQTLQNTLFIAFFNIIGVVIASSLAAYAFAAMQWKFRETIFIITVATMMLPDMVLMVPQFLLFKYLGFYGSMLPLIVPYFCGLPFYIFLLRQFFLSIPQDLAEAARIDGASELEIYRKIYLPLAKPALLIVVLFQFLISWNDLMKPSVYLINEDQYTLSLALQQYQSRLGGVEWGPLMATVLIMILPVIILFIFCQKYFIRGIVMSGLKES